MLCHKFRDVLSGDILMETVLSVCQLQGLYFSVLSDVADFLHIKMHCSVLHSNLVCSCILAIEYLLNHSTLIKTFVAVPHVCRKNRAKINYFHLSCH